MDIRDLKVRDVNRRLWRAALGRLVSFRSPLSVDVIVEPLGRWTETGF